MTLETVNITPDTPLESILTFRDNYRDEIGLFRSEIGQLAQGIDPETPTFDALQAQVFDIYINQIRPAVNSLQKALEGRRIRTFVSYLSSIIFAGSLSYFELNKPLNLATYAGSQITGNTINYLIDRKQNLIDNPYSFV